MTRSEEFDFEARRQREKEEYRKWHEEESALGDQGPPWFTGEKGPRGGPMWRGPLTPMEVSPELHALTEGPGGRYTSKVYPEVTIEPAKGHHVSVTEEHPEELEHIRRDYPGHPRAVRFAVDYYHRGDEPALPDTERQDIRDLAPDWDESELVKQGLEPIGPISHRKNLYRGDNPQEAARAAVRASQAISRQTRQR
jgi:hypothetical protein